MNVDTENFEDVCRLFEMSLAHAAFVGIDLEMTGIHTPGVTEERYDLPEHRYEKNRMAAMEYGIVQIGICLFEEVVQGDLPAADGRVAGNGGTRTQYVARPFNFYVFPRPLNESPDCKIQPKLKLDSDAMHFLRCHNMDFGHWLQKGVTYLDRPGEESLRAALEKRTVIKEDTRSLGGRDAEEVQRTAEYFNNVCKPGSRHDVSRHPGRVQRGILKALHALHPNDNFVLEKRPGELGGCRELRVILRNLGPDPAAKAQWEEQELVEAERHLNEQLGFRRVWKLLLSSGRPLVMHNAKLDLLFLFHWLEEPLPERLDEFQQLVQKTMGPRTHVFDTKWLAHYTDGGADLCGHRRNTGLSALCRSLDERAHKVPPDDVFFPYGFDRYQNCNGSAAHEAAYDAYCTCRVFGYFRRYYASELQGDTPRTEPSAPDVPAVAEVAAPVSPKSLAKPTKSAAGAGAANRFAGLVDSSDDDDEDEAAEQIDCSMSVDEPHPSSSSTSGQPPRRVGYRDGMDTIFLSNSDWDLAISGSQQGRKPAGFLAFGKHCAVRYVYDAADRSQLDAVLKKTSNSLATSDKAAPLLTLRFHNQEGIGCVCLAPQQESDSCWQDDEALDRRLVSILERATVDGCAGPDRNNGCAVNGKSKKQKSTAGATSGRPSSRSFSWCKDSATALDWSRRKSVQPSK
eukprot:TRINITY_DN11887_c0_g1_i1.p1 TRINITY_DN11887_c0_g1~~TRINITY_DN11887_c0_g1_i1.p1  ORF type:complete len:683 (-),score=107.75 TRINITY_DN11887_c0_g1_i1:122-2170(-)